MRRDQTLHEELIPLLARRLGVMSYVELGCHENETIGPVRAALPVDSMVVAVDRREPSFRIPGVIYFIMETAEFLAGSAVSFYPDMVFIDADHSCGSVLADLEGIWPHVAPEGLVLLHDTNPETLADTAPGLCGDGWKAARLYRGEAVTLPYHPGLTIIRKRERWGPVR